MSENIKWIEDCKKLNTINVLLCVCVKMKVYVIVVFIREKIGAILISVQCKKESTIMEKN